MMVWLKEYPMLSFLVTYLLHSNLPDSPFLSPPLSSTSCRVLIQRPASRISFKRVALETRLGRCRAEAPDPVDSSWLAASHRRGFVGPEYFPTKGFSIVTCSNKIAGILFSANIYRERLSQHHVMPIDQERGPNMGAVRCFQVLPNKKILVPSQDAKHSGLFSPVS